MKDLRAERIHRHELRRARRRKYKRITEDPKLVKPGTQNKPQRATYFHVGSEGMTRDSFFDRIQDKKERRRARRQKEAK